MVRNTESLESFATCTLISLGLKPIGKGEKLTRIIEKEVIILLKKEITQAAGLLMLYAVQVAKLKPKYTLCMIFSEIITCFINRY